MSREVKRPVTAMRMRPGQWVPSLLLATLLATGVEVALAQSIPVEPLTPTFTPPSPPPGTSVNRSEEYPDSLLTDWDERPRPKGFFEGGFGLRMGGKPGDPTRFSGRVLMFELRVGFYVRPHLIIDGEYGTGLGHVDGPVDLPPTILENGYIRWDGSSFLNVQRGGVGLRWVGGSPDQEHFGRIGVGLENTEQEVQGTRYEYAIIMIPTGLPTRTDSDMLPTLELSGGMVFHIGRRSLRPQGRQGWWQDPTRLRLTLELGYLLRQDADLGSFGMSARGQGAFLRMSLGRTVLSQGP